jgi:acyl-CoA reductase-like NAD-dependent aldehyde dehydrogenase
LRTRLSAAAHNLICGDPLDAATDIGPLISAQHLRHVEKQIAAALETGAVLVAGGDREPCVNGLALMAPTILEARTVHLGAVRDSLFAPVVTLVAFENDEDLVCLAAQRISDTGAAIFDPHIAHALHIARQLHITSCTLNSASMSPDVDESCAFDSPRFAAHLRFHARHCETFWSKAPGAFDPTAV